MYMTKCIHVYINVLTYDIYIYICIDLPHHIYICVTVCVHIYIYTHINMHVDIGGTRWIDMHRRA